MTARATVARAVLRSRQHERDTERPPRGQFNRIKTLTRIAELSALLAQEEPR
jgi:hypothetical protein